jgi:hypothetical protein
MKQYPFKSVYPHAKEFYGIELSPDSFENIAIVAWDKIGNYRYRLYHLQTEPIKDSAGAWYVDLPCNVDFIEAVTANYEDYQKTTPMHSDGYVQNEWVEGYIETRRFNNNFGYFPGKFIKHVIDGNRLYIGEGFESINIFYKGVLADDEGLPSLTEKEVDAIAAFCAYSDLYKRSIVSRDRGLLEMALVVKADWEKKCTQARVPNHMSQNELDQILDASTSWDRKRFGKSFKPIR